MTAKQYAVKALAGGKLDSGSGDIIMYLDSDGEGSEELIEDLRNGEGYGVDYLILEREVGEWRNMPGLYNG